ncbi:hypothetical protein C4K88_03335 [Arthrobacter pityocampae]|uniref:Uncharacterized protein n=2 Tax=Arthrobacter pityocampae TaxID=547334 RepID=A0A2S5J286_9MICC|nr:hypothetical protein C4K88_03335 [Arthrobacter pityocampae]
MSSADAAIPDPGTVKTMMTIRDVLGPNYDDPFVSLSWAGRTESAAELAPRIAATTARIAAQYPAGSMQWVRAPRDLGQEPVRIPVDTDALTEMIDASFDRSLGFRNRTLLSLFLRDDPSDESSTDPSLSIGIGSGSTNSISLRLTDDFPSGSPAGAARLFVDLVRIWQPDWAEFSSISAVEATMGKGHVNHASYLAWISATAFGPEPETDREIVQPHGEGWIYAAREWTNQGIVALSEDLARGGAQRISTRPDVQHPPHIPEGYPAGLDELDRLVSWGEPETTPPS